ncbi:hypothetical protein Pyn_33674 [Prunus yedoensis var. nudiflora]|uniref:Uncharacterized protein n=1 Tax=Prunus yedoensis var. nudiflora TaxID=2094558 RepID=A0A314Z6Z8_PRUYE|nr:hypothetical protein Pyn_33674 [Prunus yedoensis var. nudiflora]
MLRHGQTPLPTLIKASARYLPLPLDEGRMRPSSSYTYTSLGTMVTPKSGGTATVRPNGSSNIDPIKVLCRPFQITCQQLTPFVENINEMSPC